MALVTEETDSTEDLSLVMLALLSVLLLHS